MSEHAISRRKFLTGAAAAVGLAAVPLVTNTKEAQAAALKDIPWTYTVQDAVAVAKRSYETYYAGGCAEATWWSIVEALSNDATNADQSLWAGVPRKLFAFGGGGVSGWGTVCGTLNGSAAVIKAVGAPNSLVDAIMTHYAEAPVPSNGVDTQVRAGWVPTVTGWSTKYFENTPSCIGHTQLCHASVSAWTMLTGNADGGLQQQDRCAKACYDMTFKTVTLLNAWKSSGALPTVTLDPTVTQCAGSCHAAAGPAPMKTKMACDSCHDEPVDHLTK